MKRFVFAAILAALCCDSSHAFQKPPKGDHASIEVEGGEVQLLVKKLPVTLVAPEGAKVYIWQADGQVSIGTSNKFVVTKGRGPIVFKLMMIEADFSIHEAERTINIDVGPPPPPPVPPTATLKGDKASIYKGQSVVLTWSSTNADPGSPRLNDQPVAPSGSLIVSPVESTTYIFSVSKGDFVVNAQFRVELTDKPPPPIEAAGLRVMIIEESLLSRDKPTIAAAMGTAPGTLRDFLRQFGAKDSTGNTDSRFNVDKSSKFDLDLPHWEPAYVRAKKFAADNNLAYPLLVYSNGVTGGIVTLPATPAEQVALCQPLKGERFAPEESPLMRVASQSAGPEARLLYQDAQGRRFAHLNDATFEKSFNGILASGDKYRHVLVNGEKRFLALDKSKQDKSRKPRGMMSFEESGLRLIPESEWPSWIAHNDLYKAWPLNYCWFTCKDQNGRSSCWGSAPMQIFQNKRAQQGLPAYEISTCSVTGPITDYRDVGGYGELAVEYANEHGAVTALSWPNNSYISSYFQPTLPERPRHKILRFVECKDRKELFSCIAQGHAVSVDLGYWSHVVGDYAFASPTVAIGRNSWDGWGTTLSFPNGTTQSGFFTLEGSKMQDVGEGNSYALIDVTFTVSPQP